MLQLCLFLVISLLGLITADYQRECVMPGFSCSSCHSYSLCLGLPGKNVRKLEEVKCATDEVCIHRKGCVKGDMCKARPFTCKDEGYFPDPNDCQLFHICQIVGSTMSHIKQRCPDGYFSLETKGCKVGNGRCPPPLPECQSEEDAGSLPGDPSYFYVCIQKDDTLAPWLFKCPPGLIFNAEHFSCESNLLTVIE